MFEIVDFVCIRIYDENERIFFIFKRVFIIDMNNLWYIFDMLLLK